MKKFYFKFTVIFVMVAVLLTPSLSLAKVLPKTTPGLLTDPSTPFVLAVEKDYPPFLFYENGQTQGIAYDYVKLIADKLGKELKTTEPLQLEQMLAMVKNGKANLLADITKTPERSAYLEFSNSYVNTPAVVISRTNNTSDWDKNSGNVGVKVAIGKGYGVVSYLKNKYPSATLLELASDSDVVRAVATGVTDVGVLDTGSLSYLLQKEPLSNIVVVSDTGFFYSLSFAVSKENKAIISSINDAIGRITAEERSLIYSKWLSTIPKMKEEGIPEYLIFLLGILVVIILIISIFTIFLRRLVKTKTKELILINKELDTKIKEKTKQAEFLIKQSDAKNNDLKNTERAVLNILEDVQEEKNKLAQVSSRLELATKSAKIGVWDLDVARDLYTWDEQMYNLFGVKKEDFNNARDALQSGLHPDDKKLREDAIQAALKGEGDYSIQFRVIWPSGEVHYIQAHAIVERDPTGEPLKMVGVNWDITKEKEIDKQKTEFVSLASHQLKTPIGSIQWDLEMLIAGDYGLVTGKQKKVLNEAYTMSKRMNDLVNALLNISRIEMGVFIIEPKPTDLVKLCEEVIQEMEPRLSKKGHELVKDFDKNLNQIPADEKLLRIVYQNFISNAIKYTPDQGKIKVAIKTDGQEVVFSVANNGEPIPTADQSKIFSKMFRASNAQEQDPDGNGLGLYVVKQIVENGGGKIWFTSKKGEDTVFACSFPLSGMVAKSGTKQLA